MLSKYSTYMCQCCTDKTVVLFLIYRYNRMPAPRTRKFRGNCDRKPHCCIQNLEDIWISTIGSMSHSKLTDIFKMTEKTFKGHFSHLILYEHKDCFCWYSAQSIKGLFAGLSMKIEWLKSLIWVHTYWHWPYTRWYYLYLRDTKQRDKVRFVFDINTVLHTNKLLNDLVLK